jgi:hypothetical protein
VVQDGELIARAFAEFYDIASKEPPPHLMGGDVDRNSGGKGDVVTFTVYYYDPSAQPPSKVEVVINGKVHPMEGEAKPDHRKPVRFQYRATLAGPANDYCFVASNGRRERRVPAEYLLPGPFIVK